MVKWSNDSEGAKVAYKARPLSAPMPMSPKVSAANTLDAIRTLVANPKLTDLGLFIVDRSGETLAVALSPQALFPHDNGDRVADLPALLEKFQDAAKSTPFRKANLPSFPVSLPLSLAPEGLKDYLWRSGREPPVPHQLLNPDPKLLASKNSPHSNLADTLSLSTALAMLRTWMKVMAADPSRFSTEEWS